MQGTQRTVCSLIFVHACTSKLYFMGKHTTHGPIPKEVGIQRALGRWKKWWPMKKRIHASDDGFNFQHICMFGRKLKVLHVVELKASSHDIQWPFSCYHFSKCTLDASNILSDPGISDLWGSLCIVSPKNRAEMGWVSCPLHSVGSCPRPCHPLSPQTPRAPGAVIARWRRL